MQNTFTKQQSKTAGLGLFTNKAFEKNTLIMRIEGEVISLRKFFKLPQKRKDNTIRFSEHKYLDPDKYDCRYLNHSCTPNTKIVKKRNHLYLEAIKKIPKNSELTFDYSTILAQDDYWTMKCICRSKSCRRVIKRYNLLPLKILNRYLKNDWIPHYILTIPKDV